LLSADSSKSMIQTHKITDRTFFIIGVAYMAGVLIVSTATYRTQQLIGNMILFLAPTTHVVVEQ
jgi:hypothetical protein